MSHIFTAEGLGRDYLSKSLGGLAASRGPPSLLHNGTISHGNLAAQVRKILYTCSTIFY